MKDIDLLVQYALKNEIKAPQELNENFIKEFSERRVSRHMKPKFAAAVAVPLMLAIAGTGAYAVSKNGYFRDKTNVFGTVTGETYENASEEIDIQAKYDSEAFDVKVVFKDPNAAPYKYEETLDIGSFTVIAQEDGSEVVCGEVEPVAVNGGTAELKIPVGELKSGSYSICISSFIGGKKAEQPLEIKGNWSLGIDIP